MKPTWKGHTGILKVSSETELSKEIQVSNIFGNQVSLRLVPDENRDVERGDPLVYTNHHGERVFVYFQ